MTEKTNIKNLLMIACDQLNEAKSMIEDCPTTYITADILACILDKVEETEVTLQEVIEKGYWR